MNASFEVLNPKIRKKRLIRGGCEYVVQPFFPCYIFVRFDPDLHYRLIKYTRGVRKIVGNHSDPWPLGEEMVGIIRTRINNDGYVEVRPDIKVGDKVEILDSSLKGFAGIFEREMKDSDRVMVLLDTIEYQARIAIERQFLKKIDASS